MQTTFKNQKLDWCKDELHALLVKLQAGNYHQTAAVVSDHIAHTGVETDLATDLKQEPDLETFLASD